MKKMRVVVILVVTAALLMGTAFAVSARSKTGVVPPTSRVQGLTYGEWLAKWWEYALTLPAAENPLTDETGNGCVFQRIGNVGLVVANSTLSVPIQCEAPSGMMLYIEVLGAECSNLEEDPFYGGTEEELRTCAQSFVPENMEAVIDGTKVKNLNKYIFTSPLYEFTNPEDNILGVPAGTTGISIGSGAYLMVHPLSVGKHTIHVRGTYPSMEYTADKTFELTIKK